MLVPGTVAASQSAAAALRSQMRGRQRAGRRHPLDDGDLAVWDPTSATVSCLASLELACRRRADALAEVQLNPACARSGKEAGLRQESSRDVGLGTWCREGLALGFLMRWFHAPGGGHYSVSPDRYLDDLDRTGLSAPWQVSGECRTVLLFGAPGSDGFDHWQRWADLRPSSSNSVMPFIAHCCH